MTSLLSSIDGPGALPTSSWLFCFFLGGRAALRAKLTFVVHSVLAVGRKSELAAVAGVALGGGCDFL